MKVVAHNKEVSERALTSQWLPCPAVKATHSSPCALVSTAEFLSEWRVFPRQKNSVFDRKRRNAKYEFGMKSTRGGKRTEAWRRKHAHTQKFCGFQRKLLPRH